MHRPIDALRANTMRILTAQALLPYKECFDALYADEEMRNGRLCSPLSRRAFVKGMRAVIELRAEEAKRGGLPRPSRRRPPATETSTEDATGSPATADAGGGGLQSIVGGHEYLSPPNGGRGAGILRRDPSSTLDSNPLSPLMPIADSPPRPNEAADHPNAIAASPSVALPRPMHGRTCLAEANSDGVDTEMRPIPPPPPAAEGRPLRPQLRIQTPAAAQIAVSPATTNDGDGSGGVSEASPTSTMALIPRSVRTDPSIANVTFAATPTYSEEGGGTPRGEGDIAAATPASTVAAAPGFSTSGRGLARLRTVVHGANLRRIGTLRPSHSQSSNKKLLSSSDIGGEGGASSSVFNDGADAEEEAEEDEAEAAEAVFVRSRAMLQEFFFYPIELEWRRAQRRFRRTQDEANAKVDEANATSSGNIGGGGEDGTAANALTFEPGCRKSFFVEPFTGNGANSGEDFWRWWADVSRVEDSGDLQRDSPYEDLLCDLSQLYDALLSIKRSHAREYERRTKAFFVRADHATARKARRSIEEHRFGYTFGDLLLFFDWSCAGLGAAVRVSREQRHWVHRALVEAGRKRAGVIKRDEFIAAFTREVSRGVVSGLLGDLFVPEFDAYRDTNGRSGIPQKGGQICAYDLWRYLRAINNYQSKMRMGQSAAGYVGSRPPPDGGDDAGAEAAVVGALLNSSGSPNNVKDARCTCHAVLCISPEQLAYAAERFGRGLPDLVRKELRAHIKGQPTALLAQEASEPVCPADLKLALQSSPFRGAGMASADFAYSPLAASQQVGAPSAFAAYPSDATSAPTSGGGLSGQPSRAILVDDDTKGCFGGSPPRATGARVTFNAPTQQQHFITEAELERFIAKAYLKWLPTPRAAADAEVTEMKETVKTIGLRLFPNDDMSPSVVGRLVEMLERRPDLNAFTHAYSAMKAQKSRDYWDLGLFLTIIILFIILAFSGRGLWTSEFDGYAVLHGFTNGRDAVTFYPCSAEVASDGILANATALQCVDPADAGDSDALSLEELPPGQSHVFSVIGSFVPQFLWPTPGETAAETRISSALSPVGALRIRQRRAAPKAIHRRVDVPFSDGLFGWPEGAGPSLGENYTTAGGNDTADGTILYAFPFLSDLTNYESKAYHPALEGSEVVGRLAVVDNGGPMGYVADGPGLATVAGGAAPGTAHRSCAALQSVLYATVGGITRTYGCGGYAVDIPFNTTREEYLAVVEEIAARGWIDRATRVVVVEYFAFHRNSGMLVMAKHLLELHAGGGLTHTATASPFFLPEERTQTYVIVIFFLFVVLCLYYSLRVVYRVVSLLSSHTTETIRMFVLLLELANIGIFIFSLVAYRGVSSLSVAESDPVWQLDHYPRSYEVAYQAFDTAVIANCVNIVLSLVLALVYTQYMVSFSAIVRTLRRAAKPALALGFVALSILVGFGVCAAVALGDRVLHYHTIPDAISSLLTIIWDGWEFRILYSSDVRVFGGIFIVAFTIFFCLFLLNALTAVFTDAFDDEGDIAFNPTGLLAIVAGDYIAPIRKETQWSAVLLFPYRYLRGFAAAMLHSFIRRRFVRPFVGHMSGAVDEIARLAHLRDEKEGKKSEYNGVDDAADEDLFKEHAELKAKALAEWEGIAEEASGTVGTADGAAPQPAALVNQAADPSAGPREMLFDASESDGEKGGMPRITYNEYNYFTQLNSDLWLLKGVSEGTSQEFRAAIEGAARIFAAVHKLRDKLPRVALAGEFVDPNRKCLFEYCERELFDDELDTDDDDDDDSDGEKKNEKESKDNGKQKQLGGRSSSISAGAGGSENGTVGANDDDDDAAPGTGISGGGGLNSTFNGGDGSNFNDSCAVSQSGVSMTASAAALYASSSSDETAPYEANPNIDYNLVLTLFTIVPQFEFGWSALDELLEAAATRKLWWRNARQQTIVADRAERLEARAVINEALWASIAKSAGEEAASSDEEEYSDNDDDAEAEAFDIKGANLRALLRGNAANTDAEEADEGGNDNTEGANVAAAEEQAPNAPAQALEPTPGKAEREEGRAKEAAPCPNGGGKERLFLTPEQHFYSTGLRCPKGRRRTIVDAQSFVPNLDHLERRMLLGIISARFFDYYDEDGARARGGGNVREREAQQRSAEYVVDSKRHSAALEPYYESLRAERAQKRRKWLEERRLAAAAEANASLNGGSVNLPTAVRSSALFAADSTSPEEEADEGLAWGEASHSWAWQEYLGPADASAGDDTVKLLDKRLFCRIVTSLKGGGCDAEAAASLESRGRSLPPFADASLMWRALEMPRDHCLRLRDLLPLMQREFAPQTLGFRFSLEQALGFSAAAGRRVAHEAELDQLRRPQRSGPLLSARTVAAAAAAASSPLLLSGAAVIEMGRVEGTAGALGTAAEADAFSAQGTPRALDRQGADHPASVNDGIIPFAEKVVSGHFEPPTQSHSLPLPPQSSATLRRRLAEGRYLSTSAFRDVWRESLGRYPTSAEMGHIMSLFSGDRINWELFAHMCQGEPTALNRTSFPTVLASTLSQHQSYRLSYVIYLPTLIVFLIHLMLLTQGESIQVAESLRAAYLSPEPATSRDEVAGWLRETIVGGIWGDDDDSGNSNGTSTVNATIPPARSAANEGNNYFVGALRIVQWRIAFSSRKTCERRYETYFGESTTPGTLRIPAKASGLTPAGAPAGVSPQVVSFYEQLAGDMFPNLYAMECVASWNSAAGPADRFFAGDAGNEGPAVEAAIPNFSSLSPTAQSAFFLRDMTDGEPKSRSTLSDTQGHIAPFGAEAYYFDLPFALGAAEARATLDAVLDSGWVDQQTRMVIAKFVTYNHNLQLLASARIGFELSSGGNMAPASHIDMLPVRQASDPQQDAVTVLLFVFAVLYFLRNTQEAIITLGRRQVLASWTRGGLWAALTIDAGRWCQVLVHYAVVGVILGTTSARLFFWDKGTIPSGMTADNGGRYPTNVEHSAQLSGALRAIEGTSYLVLTVLCTIFITSSFRFEVILETIAVSWRDLLAIGSLFTIVLVAFACGLQLLWGYNFSFAATFGSSLIEMLVSATTGDGVSEDMFAPRRVLGNFYQFFFIIISNVILQNTVTGRIASAFKEVKEGKYQSVISASSIRRYEVHDRQDGLALLLPENRRPLSFSWWRKLKPWRLVYNFAVRQTFVGTFVQLFLQIVRPMVRAVRSRLCCFGGGSDSSTAISGGASEQDPSSPSTTNSGQAGSRSFNNSSNNENKKAEAERRRARQSLALAHILEPCGHSISHYWGMMEECWLRVDCGLPHEAARAGTQLVCLRHATKSIEKAVGRDPESYKQRREHRAAANGLLGRAGGAASDTDPSSPLATGSGAQSIMLMTEQSVDHFVKTAGRAVAVFSGQIASFAASLLGQDVPDFAHDEAERLSKRNRLSTFGPYRRLPLWEELLYDKLQDCEGHTGTFALVHDYFLTIPALLYSRSERDMGLTILEEKHYYDRQQEAFGIESVADTGDEEEVD